MYEDNKFGCFGWILLWIFDYIFYRVFLFFFFLSLGYGRRNWEGGISNNWFYYGIVYDVYIDLLCVFVFSIG